jgi:hypothetical protein
MVTWSFGLRVMFRFVMVTRVAMVGIDLSLFVEANCMCPLLTMELGALGSYGQ